MFGWFGGKGRSPGTDPAQEGIAPLPEEPRATTTDDPGHRAGGPDPDLRRLKECVRRLDRPSEWTALPHTIELAAPSEAALILWVKSEIARVAPAVDEWTADELDDAIRTQQATWDTKAEEHATARREKLVELLAQERHDLDEAAYAVSRFQEDRDTQSEAVNALRGELLGESDRPGSPDGLASVDERSRRPGKGWRDRVLGLSITGQETRLSRFGKKALVFGMLMLGLGLDAILAVPALELVFIYDRTVTFFIALMLAAFGTAAAATAGYAARGAQAAGSLGGRVWAGVLVSIWLALGGLISLIRVVAADTSAARPWESADTGLGAEAIVPALTFFIVWLACGALAAHDMYTSRNDAQAKREIAAAALENSRIQLAWLEPLKTRLTMAIKAREAQLDDVDAALARAIARHAAIADRLTAEARHELAAHHGDPAFTGITSVMHPNHPRTVRQPAPETAAPQLVESHA